MKIYLYLQSNAFAIIAILVMYFSRREKKKTLYQVTFDRLLISTLAVLVLDSISWMLEGKMFNGARTIHMAVLDLYFFAQMIPPLMWLMYCERIIHKEIKPRKLAFYRIFLLSGIVYLIINHGTGKFYYLDEQNLYRRGSNFLFWALIPIYYLLYAWGMSFFEMLKKRKEDNLDYFFLVVCPLLNVICAFLQTFIYGTTLIWTSTVISLLIVYINVQSRQNEKLEYQLSQERIRIMLSQIQPHFLYNVLTTIVDLCDRDVRQAKEAILEFSAYLRGNMDSLTQNRPIPFEIEKKHVMTYLSLEKKRFGEELQIEWDIENTSFMIPSLTIQPLVENAVKNGVEKKEEGGTVVIRTREKEECHEVMIEDDGVGFDVSHKKNDGRSHVGIENVRYRLKEICGGSLTITSEEGKGTTAVITLPK